MRPPTQCDLLLTGGAVVTMDNDRRVLESGAVATIGERIVAVGTPDELADWRPARTIDCTGKAVLPGLVDCHSHLFQYLIRGLGEGMALWPWLTEVMWPVSEAIAPEDARAAALLGALEAARAGVTCVLDHHYAPTDLETTCAVADAMEAVGIRGAVARGILGEPTELARDHGRAGFLYRYSAAEELDITRACVERHPPDGPVTVWPAPLNVTFIDHDLIGSAVELARELGTGWHTHCSEARQDPDVHLEVYGTRPVEWLHAEGLLGPGTALAHAIWLDDTEVGQLGETGSGVCHCPISNAYIGAGVMRFRALREAGAVVGLGADGAGAHQLDILDVARQAVLLQRVSALDPTAALFYEALEAATRDGARLVGVDAGVLAPDRLADIAIVALDRPHLVPVHSPVATLGYSARGPDVETTIAGGRVIYENGRSTQVDEEALMSEVAGRAKALVERSGIGAHRH